MQLQYAYPARALEKLFAAIADVDLTGNFHGPNAFSQFTLNGDRYETGVTADGQQFWIACYPSATQFEARQKRLHILSEALNKALAEAALMPEDTTPNDLREQIEAGAAAAAERAKHIRKELHGEQRAVSNPPTPTREVVWLREITRNALYFAPAHGYVVSESKEEPSDVPVPAPSDGHDAGTVVQPKPTARHSAKRPRRK